MAEPTRSVLQVVTSTQRRGAEVFATELGRALTGLGWSVRTVALAPAGGGVQLDLPTLGRRPLGLSTLRALRAEMRRVDVTIAHGSRTLPASALAGLGTRSRVVYRNIGDPRFWLSTGLRRLRAGWAMRRATQVVALSDDAATELADRLRVAGGAITVIPQAGDVDRFQPSSTDERAAARRALGLPADGAVVAVVGALSPEKDPELAVESVAALDDVHLLLAGDGPSREKIEAAAARRPDHMHIAGMLDDPGAAYAAADVVLLTSRSEGMPAVLIEAGLCALPVVTTDVGFVRDIVVDGVTGFVVSSRVPSVLGSAVRAALADRERLGAAARQHCAEHFDLGALARRWDDVLTSVVHR
jgi:glycosyltransferase involved in cell wall biosynthesis